MVQVGNVLWLSASPHLKRFDQRLLCQLARRTRIQRWEYIQSADEPCCLETPVTLLHDYVKGCDRKIHLMGHGLSGIIGLLYTRRFPQRVSSLTLLSVNPQPAVNWHSHYYALRNLLPCGRDIILAQMVRCLFGPQTLDIAKALMKALEQDLDTGLSLHSLGHSTAIAPGGIKPPLLICYGQHDDVIGPCLHERWKPFLKSEDQLWQCLDGKHFFHFTHPQGVATAILEHWKRAVDIHYPPSLAVMNR